MTFVENAELNDNFRMVIPEEDPEPHIGRLALNDLDPFFKGRSPATEPLIIGKDNYVAMSYSWGPENPTTTILVDGVEVQVRLNLEAGLRQFRDMEFFKAGGKIWIDALSINQNDKDEVAAQVQMMGEIYGLAGNVLVWLGEEADGSDKVIEELEKLGRLYRTEYIEIFDGSDPWTAISWREVAQVQIRASLKRWVKLLREHYHKFDRVDNDVRLHQFFDRPYWRRLWIIQELAMGRAGMPMMCGSRVTQWRYIRDAVFLFASVIDLIKETTSSSFLDVGKEMVNESSIYHVAQIAQLEAHGHRKPLPHVDTTYLTISSTHGYGHGPLLGSALRRALILASESNSFKPHDRIYGMLSIPGLPDLGIKVDYTKKISTVFTQFARACIERGLSLEVFSLLDGGGLSLTDLNGNSQDEDMPSWVPDFSAHIDRRLGVIEGEWYASGNKQGFVWMDGAILGTTPDVSPVVEGETLVCHGFVAEMVDGVGAISEKDMEGEHIKAFGRNFETSVVQPGMPKAELYDNSNEVPDDPTWTSWDIDRLGNWMISQKEKMKQINRAVGNAVDPRLYWVLVGGTDIAGNKQGENFSCLYNAFPSK